MKDISCRTYYYPCLATVTLPVGALSQSPHNKIWTFSQAELSVCEVYHLSLGDHLTAYLAQFDLLNATSDDTNQEWSLEIMLDRNDFIFITNCLDVEGLKMLCILTALQSNLLGDWREWSPLLFLPRGEGVSCSVPSWPKSPSGRVCYFCFASDVLANDLERCNKNLFGSNA